jgi:carotenoid cleavage dioxygenase-like enzyme
MSYHRANASGELIIDRGVDVSKLTMMHDFALSAEHIVLMDLPIVFRLDIARNSPRDLPYHWSDDYGDRLGVLRRDDPYGPIRWFDIAPCYVFHVLNAFDKTTDAGNVIVLQAARYTELWHDDGAPGSGAMMWSWTINLTRGIVTEEQIDERAVEFPRIDDRLVGLPARYGVTVGMGKLVRYDLERAAAEEHSFDTATKPGGPG